MAPLATNMHRSQGSVSVLTLSLALTVIGASVFNVLPLLTSAATDALGFTGQQVGVMSLVISASSGVGALLAGTWVRSAHWARAAVWTLAGTAGSVALAMLVHSYAIFAIALGAAGFFATGVGCLGMTILSDRSEPARIFGVAISAQVLYQAITILAGPMLLRVGGLNGVLAMLMVPAALASCFARLLPAQGRAVVSQRAIRALLKPAPLSGLAGYGIFFINVGAYWTYIELMGRNQGINALVVAECLSIGISSGLLGSALAWAIGERLGKFRPLVIATILTVGAAFLLRDQFGVLAFATTAVLYLLALNYSVVYQLAIVNEVDGTGRGVAVMQAFAFFGAAAGAGLSALYVSPVDYRAVVWIVTAAVTLSTVLFAVSTLIHRSNLRASATKTRP